MGDGAGLKPDTDAASLHRSKFEVMHDQRWFRLSIQVQPGLASRHDQLHVDPSSEGELGIGFVLLRRFRAQAIEAEVRVGDILHTMIAPLLVIGGAVRGAQVDTLESSLPVNAEADPDKASRVGWGVGAKSLATSTSIVPSWKSTGSQAMKFRSLSCSLAGS